MVEEGAGGPGCPEETTRGASRGVRGPAILLVFRGCSDSARVTSVWESPDAGRLPGRGDGVCEVIGLGGMGL